MLVTLGTTVRAETDVIHLRLPIVTKHVRMIMDLHVNVGKEKMATHNVKIVNQVR